MSSLGSSFVNKSGKKVAPKAAVRRRPAPPAAPTPTQPAPTPPKEPTPSRSASVPHETQPSAATSEVVVTQVVESDGSTTLSAVTTPAIAQGIVDSIEPATTKHQTLDITISTEDRSSQVPEPLTQNQPTTTSRSPIPAIELRASSNTSDVRPSGNRSVPPADEPVRLEVSLPVDGPPEISATPALGPNEPQIIFETPADRTSSTTGGRKATSAGATAATRKPKAKAAKASAAQEPASFIGPQIVQYEVPTSPQRQRKTPATTGDEDQPESNTTTKRKRQSKKADSAATTSTDVADGDPDAPSVVTLPPAVEDSSKKRKAPKAKAQPRKKARTTPPPETSTANQEEGQDAAQNEASGSSAPDPKSARMNNAEKRRQRKLAKAEALGLATAERQISGPAPADNTVRESIEPASTDKPRPKKRRKSSTRTAEPADGEENLEGDETTTEAQAPRPRRQRKATPEGSEAVTIVPGVVTMYELAQRNLRTGWKSEREKLMAKIDWADVKRRRKEEERQFAMNRGRISSQTPEPEGGQAGAGAAADGDDEEVDLDAALERAVNRSKRKQHIIQLKIVGGQHVVDESSMVIDRYAMANEEAELLEELEENDLTKHFNSQTHMCLRRKEPEERVRNWDRWTDELTDRFYDCLSRFGTDFMIISKMFKGRTRREIKYKFVREERLDPDRVRDALNGALRGGDDCWDVEEFKFHAGLADHEMKDPAELEAELSALRKEREKEIDEARKKAAEEKRQKKLAGAASDDEDDEGGGRKKKKKKKGKRGRGMMGGGEEVEIVYDE